MSPQSEGVAAGEVEDGEGRRVRVELTQPALLARVVDAERLIGQVHQDLRVAGVLVPVPVAEHLAIVNALGDGAEL